MLEEMISTTTVVDKNHQAYCDPGGESIELKLALRSFLLIRLKITGSRKVFYVLREYEG